jgi:hypothetical protein
MKVLVYFTFSKFFFLKKVKSPSSMRNGRIHPPKCRDKLQKMGVLYINSPKMPGPSPNFLIIPNYYFLNKLKNCKIVKLSNWQACGWRATSGRPPLLARYPKHQNVFFLLPTYFCTCGQLLLVCSSTCLPYVDFS